MKSKNPKESMKFENRWNNFSFSAMYTFHAKAFDLEISA